MRFEVLGRMAVVGSDDRRVEVRAAAPARLLAALALEHPRALSRGEITELLWPGDVPGDLPVDAARAVRQVVSRARAAMVAAGAPAGALVSADGATSLLLDDVVVDLRQAAAAVASAESRLAAGDPRAALTAAHDALARLDLGLFGSDDPWFLAWRERTATLATRARYVAVEAALAAGRFAEGVALGEAAYAADEFDEHAARLLMRALAAAGQRPAALAVHERLRRVLDDELGVRPSLATEDLYVELLGDAPQARDAVVRAPGITAARAGTLPFVGRARELGVLATAWRALRDTGSQHVVIVSGEPGIGKTRLVAEAVARADDDTAIVWGQCHAGGVVGYEPYAAVATQIVAQRPEIATRVGTAVLHDLALVAPDVVASAPTVTTADEHAQGRLFRAVATILRTAVTEPTVMVLDDMQWADADTVALTLHALDASADLPLLAVLIARDVRDSLAELVGELRRRPTTVTLDLHGLAADEIGELLAHGAVATTRPADQAATMLADRTAGNALFVTQYVRAAQSSASPLDPMALPAALAEILAARFATLDAGARAVLDLAAVVGPEPDLAVMEACAAVDAATLVDHLVALRSRHVMEERGLDSFAFVHELVREAVLEALGATRCARLHARVASALVELGGEAERIAHHFAHAGPRANDETVVWSQRAGDAMLRRGAWTSAAEHFELAVRLASTAAARADALVGLGRARRGLGDVGAARAALHDALDVARATSDGARRAAATLALVGGGGRGVALDLDDAHRAELLRAANAALGPDDGAALRIAVLGELALALVLTDAVDERIALCDECLAVARAAGDAAGLAFALQTRRIALMGPDGTRERVADARELLALDATAVPIDRRIAAELALVEDLVELGDRDGARAALGAAAALVEEYPHPYWEWATETWAVLDALIDARLDDVEPMAFAAFARQAAGDHPEATAALGVELTDLRIFQGRAGEMVTLLADAADGNPQIPCYRAVLALCLCESGHHDGAARELDALAARGDQFGLPRDSNWLLATAVLATVASTIGRVDHARRLRSLLEPYADRHVVLNCYGGGGAYWGPVTLHLATLAALLGDDAGAARWRADAIAAAESFGAPWFVARASDGDGSLAMSRRGA